MRVNPTTLLLAAILLGSCARESGESVDLLIRSAEVVDVANGTLLHDRTIAVKNAVIVETATPPSKFRATRAIDARGKYVIPGLWDMHVHFGGGEKLIEENKNLLPLYVAHGITTVRDAAGDLSPSVLEWRDAVSRRTLLGPTIYTSGPKLEGYNSIWPGDLEVGSEAEIEAGLDSLQAMHVDFVKITDSALSPSLYLAALAAASRRSFKTSAHLPMALTLDQVSAAGLDSIEHMSYLLKAGSPREQEISAAVAAGTLSAADAMTKIIDTFDPAVARATYARLAARGTAIVPTLNISRILAYLDRDDHRRDPYLEYLGPGLKATYNWRIERAAKDDAAAVERRHERYEMSVRLLPLVHQAGMRIIAGTDAGFLNSFNYPGISLHEELEIFVKAGLTPMQTLQTAILNGPAFLGKSDRYGSITKGKVADLVILNRNPLEDIRATRDIHAVVLKGNYLDRASLDSLLEQTRVKAAARH